MTRPVQLLHNITLIVACLVLVAVAVMVGDKALNPPPVRTFYLSNSVDGKKPDKYLGPYTAYECDIQRELIKTLFWLLATNEVRTRATIEFMKHSDFRCEPMR